MNKFRGDLHSMLFYQGVDGLPSRDFLDNGRESGLDALNIQDQLDQLESDIVEKINFSSVTEKIIEEKRKAENFNQEDENRFKNRLEATNSEGKPYSEVRNKKVEEGFKRLINSLEEQNFFEGRDKSSKTKEIARLKVKYLNEVKSQTIRNIWDTEDEDFDKIKDTIFSADSTGNPSDKLFYDLMKQRSNLIKRSKIRGNAVEKTGESDNVESAKVSKRVDFLGRDLPNCLRETQDPGLLEKIFTKTDSSFKEDKEQIKKFIKAEDKLNGGDNELELIKVFDELPEKASNDEIKERLEIHNLSLKKDSYISDIKEVFDFYIKTQSPDAKLRDQHPMYVDILTRIQKEGGFDRTIKAYEKRVANYQTRKDAEGKEYSRGKKLTEEYRAFASALKIEDFTNATRLSEKGEDYFKDAKVVDILADLNNDGEISPADRGITKTGSQFKEIFTIIGEDVALRNLIEQAKILNKNLDESVRIPEDKIDASEIKKGNKELILMLQSIIANPGQDLYTLMLYGPDASERHSEVFESLKTLPENAEDERVQSAATNLLKEKGITPDSIQLDGVTYEGLHQAVAGALFRQYSTDVENMLVKGAGIGTSISFDDLWDRWVKGLALNAGFQMTEKGLGFGLTLSYKKEFDLGKGWSVTPGAHCGFIMLGSIPAFEGGLSSELAKQWINDNHIAEKLGGQLGFTYITPAVMVFSVMLGWSRDKAKGIEQSKDKMKDAFNSEIVTPLLDKIAEKFGEKEFDLTNQENITSVNEAIDEVIKAVLGDRKSEFTDEDIKKLKDNTIRLLINYNKAPISNRNVRRYMASEMSENYANVWVEQSINNIDKKVYLSGARLGVSWVQAATFGAPVFHLGISLKKHRVEGYGDGSIREYDINALSGSKRTQEMVDHFNRFLAENTKLSLSEDGKYVVLSKDMIEAYNVLINPGMKGLIKKNESGDVLLSVETYINLPKSFRGVATKSTDILIGGGDASNATRLQSVMNDNSWFATGEIDTSRLTGKEIIFTKDKIDLVLQKLKDNIPDDIVLQNFEFDDSILSKFEAGKKYKIILEKDNNSITTKVEQVNVGDALQIEYIGSDKVELMSSVAQKIANTAYLEARKVESNALYSISHGKGKWESYVKFANAMKDKKYKDAKDIIKNMLPNMDRFINKRQKNKVKFSSMISDLDDLKNEVELGQALLSINNIFARVASVHGGGEDGQYLFKKYVNGRMVENTMDNIVKSRAGEIERRIKKASNLDETVQEAYTSLIGAMETYRTENPEYYNADSKKPQTLQNAVGINLGNALNVENPLFNPEIYEGSRIELKDLPDFQRKDNLQKHAMEVMAKDKSLMGPVLKALGIDMGNEYSVVSYDNGTLTIDINHKKVKFSAGMSVGYFAQCVNHMILLDNIQAEIVGGAASVQFGPGVMGNGQFVEGTKKSTIATSSLDLDVAAGLGNKGTNESDNTQTQVIEGEDVDNGEVPTDED